MNKSSSFVKKLYEAAPKEGFKILIITSRSEENKDQLFTTARRVKETCDKRKIPNYIVFVDDATIERVNSVSYIIHSSEDNKDFEFNPHETVALVRGSVTKFRSTLDLISQLEKAGLFCINYRDCMEICGDKYRTILKLADIGVSTPKTALIQNKKSIDHALGIIGDKFPIVVKTLSGSHGIGVFFVESRKSLTSILQVIWKIDEEAELLIQEYVPTDFDVRAHVLGDKVIGAMRRDVIEDDFRSNFSLGGKVKKYKLSKEEEEACLLAAKAVGGIWVGVDFIPTKDGLRVIEVNSSPGTEGIEEATKEDIVSVVLDYISDKNNWTYKATECGYLETIHIKEFGDIVAKLDTGNGNHCALHADEYTMDEKKKTVTWTFKGKKYKRDLVEIQNTEVGGFHDHTEERPVVKFDIEFNNDLYPNIKCTLTNRETKISPILLNRYFMKKAKVMVNPGKKFVLSTKPKDEEKKDNE